MTSSMVLSTVRLVSAGVSYLTFGRPSYPSPLTRPILLQAPTGSSMPFVYSFPVATIQTIAVSSALRYFCIGHSFSAPSGSCQGHAASSSCSLSLAHDQSATRMPSIPQTVRQAPPDLPVHSAPAGISAGIAPYSLVRHRACPDPPP
jgi:hypothetical protein